MDPDRRLVTTVDIIRDALSSGAHKKLFDTIESIVRRGESPTMMYVSDLSGDPKLATECAADYSQNMNSVRQYAGRLMDLWMIGVLRETGREMAKTDDSADPNDVIEYATKKLFPDSTGTQVGQTIDIDHGIRSTIASMSEESRRFKTGFPSLDEVCGGWREGSLNVIGAGTSVGKSNFLICTGLALANAGRDVALVTIEMAPDQMLERALSVLSRVSLTKIIDHNIHAGDMVALNSSKKRLDSMKGRFVIESPPSMSMTAVMASIRRLGTRMERPVILVDYLQRIRVDGMRGEQAVSEISATLANYARLSGLTLIVGAQANRAPSERKDPEPTKHDLRGSGSIENDADTVVMIYRPEMYGVHAIPVPGGSLMTRGKAWLIVDKNRHGKRGKVMLDFNADTAAFIDPKIGSTESLPFAREEAPF